MQQIESQSALAGVWKSNEQKTLQSLHSVKGLAHKQKQFFENDFFGHLTVEYRENEAKVYFDNDNTEEPHKFYPYQLIEENEKAFVIKFFDEFEGVEKKETLHREGACYYVVGSKWTKLNFREYFCRSNN